jgi:glycerol-3-phosphate dehydrogenase
MFSVEGVKFTTARGTAEQAVDAVIRSLGLAGVRCRTQTVPVDESPLPGRAELDDQVRNAIREEMAVRLSDVMLRRIWPIAPAGPSRTAVVGAARIAAVELGWTPAREQAEIDDVLRQLASGGATMVPVA